MALLCIEALMPSAPCEPARPTSARSKARQKPALAFPPAGPNDFVCHGHHLWPFADKRSRVLVCAVAPVSTEVQVTKAHPFERKQDLLWIGTTVVSPAMPSVGKSVVWIGEFRQKPAPTFPPTRRDLFHRHGRHSVEAPEMGAGQLRTALVDLRPILR